MTNTRGTAGTRKPLDFSPEGLARQRMLNRLSALRDSLDDHVGAEAGDEGPGDLGAGIRALRKDLATMAAAIERSTETDDQMVALLAEAQIYLAAAFGDLGSVLGRSLVDLWERRAHALDGRLEISASLPGGHSDHGG